LPQPFQLRLCNDQLTLKRSGSLEHGLALFFYVDSAVLAGELAEFLLGVLQILIDLRKAFLKENAFAPRGRCAEVRNELIELIGKRPGHVRSALRITVRDAYSDHLVLAINRKSRIAGKLPASVLGPADAIHLLQVKLFDDVVLYGSAPKDAD